MQNKLVIHSYIHSRTVPYIANMVSDSSYLTCWEYNNKKRYSHVLMEITVESY